MKVLHVIPALAPRYGGPSVTVVRTSRALRGHGIDPLIASTDADGPGRLEVPLGVETTFEGEPAIFFRRVLSESYKYSPDLASWLATSVSRFDCVHIHAVFSHSSLAAGRASRAAAVPYVLRPLGSFDPWALRRKSLPKAALWHAGVGRLVRGAAALHCTTDDERRLAEASLGALSYVVIPPGLDDEEPAAAAADDEERQADRYVLALSRLHPVKGLELLIECFLDAAADDAAASWRLVIAGDGDAAYVDRLRAIGRRHPAGSRVVFAGWLDGAAKVRVLRGASLFALPSHQESFGLSALEALSHGVPVILTEGVNLAPAVAAAEAGWVVPRDRVALAAVLIEAMRSPAERSRRGAQGRVLSEKYRWSSVAGQLADLYELITVKCAA
jgi:glycosyltransferase involved in cell wall biosynthesis